MLDASSPVLCEHVWSLISKLPYNESVIEDLKTLKFIKDIVLLETPISAAAAEQAASAWK